MRRCNLSSHCRIRVAALGLLATIALPALAHGQGLSCGAILTQDTTLQQDLVGCSGPGLIIGAPNITVNLNRHTVAGDGAGFFVGVNGGFHAGVTVWNGIVRDFAVGVAVSGNSNHVWGLEVLNTSFAIVVAVSHGSLVEKNIVRNGGQGLTVQEGARGNVISSNEITASDFGIALFDSDATVIDKNRVEDNVNGGIFVVTSLATSIEKNDVSLNGGFGGIALLDLPVGTLISKNHVMSNANGIFVVNSSEATVVDKNAIYQNTVDGIRVESVSTTITRNTANDNGNWGINAVPGVIDGGGNKARGNGVPAQCTGVVCS